MASCGPLQGGGGSQGSGCCCLGHLPGDFPGAVGLQCYRGVLDLASIDLQLRFQLQEFYYWMYDLKECARKF